METYTDVVFGMCGNQSNSVLFLQNKDVTKRAEQLYDDIFCISTFCRMKLYSGLLRNMRHERPQDWPSRPA